MMGVDVKLTNLNTLTPDYFPLNVSPVGQEKIPYGIDCHQDRSCIITDGDTRTVHLVTIGSVWIRQLWGHPSDSDPTDPLFCDCVSDCACLCCTRRGSILILEISFSAEVKSSTC